MRKQVFEIVESPIAGDPLAPLRMQGMVNPQLDWRNLLHHHIMKAIEPETCAQREMREESSFQGFPPNAFEPQPGDLARLALELGAVHDDNEDRTASLSDDFLADMKREVESIFGGNVTFRHFTFDEDGNMVEI